MNMNTILGLIGNSYPEHPSVKNVSRMDISFSLWGRMDISYPFYPNILG
jgi:hypothetical protein